MAKENYSKYEMNGVLKVLPFSYVSLYKSNTKCTKLLFYHYKIINNIAIKHLLLTVIALCMDTFALATPPSIAKCTHLRNLMWSSRTVAFILISTSRGLTC